MNNIASLLFLGGEAAALVGVALPNFMLPPLPWKRKALSWTWTGLGSSCLERRRENGASSGGWPPAAWFSTREAHHPRTPKSRSGHLKRFCHFTFLHTRFQSNNQSTIVRGRPVARLVSVSDPWWAFWAAFKGPQFRRIGCFRKYRDDSQVWRAWWVKLTQTCIMCLLKTHWHQSSPTAPTQIRGQLVQWHRQMWIGNSSWRDQTSLKKQSATAAAGISQLSTVTGLVLDIAGPAVQPHSYVPLMLRRPDERRQLTQKWKFTQEGRLVCAHPGLFVQAKDGFSGIAGGKIIKKLTNLMKE